MADRKVYIKGFSQEITFRRNTRIKRLSIKVSLGSGVVVCIPKGINEKMAVDFVLKNKVWIEKHSQKYHQQPISNEIKLVNYTVVFLEIEHNKWRIQKNSATIVIEVPKTLVFSEKEKLKRKLFEQVLKFAAKKFLPKRVAELATLHNFEYRKLSLRNQKTRWGSCSHNNNISLNIQLMRLPLHLIDYVIIHELSHTVHKNHSTYFWNLVHQKMGDSLYLCKKKIRYCCTEL